MLNLFIGAVLMFIALTITFLIILIRDVLSKLVKLEGFIGEHEDEIKSLKSKVKEINEKERNREYKEILKRMGGF